MVIKNNAKKSLRSLQSSQWGLLLISVVLGIIATIFVHIYIKSRIISISGGSMVNVVIASTDIDPNTELTETMLGAKSMPSGLIHQMAIAEKDKGFLIGQKTQVQISTGEVILWTDMVLKKPLTLAQKLGMKERAVTIPLPFASSNKALIVPGDRIDILGSFEIPGPDYQSVYSMTKILLQNITVLAVGASMEYHGEQDSTKQDASLLTSTGEQGAQTITLKVTPKEAAILTFAQRKGELTLVLRSREDVVVEPIPDITFKQLVGYMSIPVSASSPDQQGYPDIYQQGRKQNAYNADKGFGKKINPILPQLQNQAETLMKRQMKNTTEPNKNFTPLNRKTASKSANT